MFWDNNLEVRKYKFFSSEITYKNKIKYDKFLLEKLRKILMEYKKEEISKEVLYEINEKMILGLK